MTDADDKFLETIISRPAEKAKSTIAWVSLEICISRLILLTDNKQRLIYFLWKDLVNYIKNQVGWKICLSTRLWYKSTI